MESNRLSFLNYVSLQDREVYEFYKAHRYRVAPGINDFNLFKKAVAGFFELMANYIKESEGGVYIENLGYFCYIISPKKKLPVKIKNTNLSLLERYKKLYNYSPYFFPDEQLSNFTASRTLIFLPTTKKKKLHFDICQSKKNGYLEARRIERGTA